MLKLIKMNQKDAKKEVNTYKNFNECLDYFKSVLLPSLTNNWFILNRYLYEYKFIIIIPFLN